jgi:hypothetical protein
MCFSANSDQIDTIGSLSDPVHDPLPLSFKLVKKILFGTEFQLISCRSPVPLYVCCVICRLVFYPKAALVPCSNIAPIVLLIRKTIIYVTPEMIPIQWPWSQTFEIGLTACQELRACVLLDW